MTLVYNTDGSYSLVDEQGVEIIRGTFGEVMDWGFVSTPEDDK